MSARNYIYGNIGFIKKRVFLLFCFSYRLYRSWCLLADDRLILVGVSW